MALLDTADLVRPRRSKTATKIIAKLAEIAPPSLPLAPPAPAKAPKPRTIKPLDVRFWSKVTRTADDTCWLFTGSVSQSTGYGQFSAMNPHTGKRTMRSSHKVAFELANGVVLEPNDHILHGRKCTSKLCCRPSHLRKGTQAENMQDAAANGFRLGSKKLTPAIAKDIVARYLGRDVPKQTKTQIAKHYGTTPQNVEHVISGRTWSKHTGVKKPEAKVATVTVEAPRKGRKPKRINIDQGAVAV
jgi:hypothetical protein